MYGYCSIYTLALECYINNSNRSRRGGIMTKQNRPRPTHGNTSSQNRTEFDARALCHVRRQPESLESLEENVCENALCLFYLFYFFPRASNGLNKLLFFLFWLCFHLKCWDRLTVHSTRAFKSAYTGFPGFFMFLWKISLWNPRAAHFNLICGYEWCQGKARDCESSFFFFSIISFVRRILRLTLEGWFNWF